MRALIAAATGLALALRPGVHDHGHGLTDGRDVTETAADDGPRTSIAAQPRAAARPQPPGREAEMRRKAGLILLALAVFFTALSPLLRWYAFPRLAKIPANQYQDMVLEAKDATLLDYGTMTGRKRSPRSPSCRPSRATWRPPRRSRRHAGRDVVVWDGLSYVQGPDGKMVSRIPERYIFDAHTQEPVHATGEMVDGDPVKRRGHRVQVALPHGEDGTTSTSTPRPGSPRPSTTRAPRTSGASRSTTSSRPSPGPRCPSPGPCPSRASPRRRSPGRARPAGTPRSASSGWNPSPEPPSTARRSTRRNSAAARSWATARR